MHSFKNTAFSLLELTVVIGIVAVMLGGGVMIGMRQIETVQIEGTEAKMEAIDVALLAFSKVHSRLPCPADATLNEDTSSSFGVEASTPGTCTGTNFTDSANVVAGQVPTKTLGLPDDYAFDTYGNRITYHIDKRITAANAFTSHRIANTDIGAISIHDASGNARTSKAVYALVSHGENGHGAYSRAGSRVNGSITNTDELENCDCTSSASNGTFNTTLVQKSTTVDNSNAANNFDDLVSYKVRSQIEHKVEQLTSGSNGGGGSDDGGSDDGGSDGGNTSCTAEKTVFSYIGAVQTYIVPEGCDSITVKAWGAGGASSYSSYYAGANPGGAGGYASANISVTAGDTLAVVVGSGGQLNDIAYGGGGRANYTSSNHSGGGGGYSGIFASSVSHANTLLIAGGGGGGGTGVASLPHGTNGGPGGGGGGTQGSNSASPAADHVGSGGMQITGGTTQGNNNDGTNSAGPLQGDHAWGGGGGGGYYGGGGGGTRYGQH
jgi:type II secretory pathway pseudopilin PulG